ncbi:MAG: NifU family protein [Spirochaetes bacterium]|nr:NifU family protein [Spirochaetota bacterium]
MKEKIEKILEEVRPSLLAHGGNVQLVDVTDDGIVKVRLTGACAGCAASTITLAYGVEKILRQKLPEIKKVVSVK